MIDFIEMYRFYSTVGVLIFLPLSSVALLELELFLKRKGSEYRSVVHWIRILFIPFISIWLALVFVAGYEITDDLPKIVATLADISGVVVALSLVNAILFTNVSENSWQAKTPKLLVDIVRLVLVVTGIGLYYGLSGGSTWGRWQPHLGLARL